MRQKPPSHQQAQAIVRTGLPSWLPIKLTMTRFQDNSERPSGNTTQPRYLWLRDVLLKQLREGQYPAGSAFPTEAQLVRDFGVSRHTVREAVRHLVDAGLLSRRPSTGTVVLAIEPRQPHVTALGSLTSLMEYSMATRLELLHREAIEVDADTAAQLEARPASRWLRLHCRRHHLDAAATVAPISLTHVYLRPEYAEVADHLTGRHPTIFDLLERLYAKPVASVTQRIDATVLEATHAHALNVEPGAPSLRLIRTYHDEGGRTMSACVNFNLASRFSLVTSWSRTDDEVSL